MVPAESVTVMVYAVDAITISGVPLTCPVLVLKVIPVGCVLQTVISGVMV